MRTFAYMVTVSCVAFGAGACSSSAFRQKDACSTTSDCLSGYSCIAQVCVSSTGAQGVSLQVIQQPNNVVAGLPASPAWVFAVSGADSVTLTAAQGNILGTTTQPVTNGQVSFSNLIFTASGDNSVVASFANETATNVVHVSPGPVDSLVITGQPTDGMMGTNLPAVTVGFSDHYGNLTGTFPGNIAASLSGNPNGVQLEGITGSVPDGSVAAFPSLIISQEGNYQLHFTSGSYSVDSNTFRVHTVAWQPVSYNGSALVAVGSAPLPGGSGKMWFMDGNTLYESPDAGKSLNALNSPGSMFQIVEDPFNANHLVGIQQITTYLSDSMVRFTSVAWGSVDAGNSWTNLKTSAVDNEHASQATFDPTVNGRIFITDSGSLMRSDDGGQTWTENSEDVVGSLVTNLGYLYSYSPSTGNVLRSTDGGDSWLKLNLSFWEAGYNNACYTATFTVDAQDANTVLVTACFGGVFVTRDAGLTWSQTLANSQQSYGVTSCSDSSGAGVLYYVSNGDLVQTSTDHGQTWQYESWGLNFTPYSVVCAPQNAEQAYAAGTPLGSSLSSCVTMTAGQ